MKTRLCQDGGGNREAERGCLFYTWLSFEPTAQGRREEAAEGNARSQPQQTSQAGQRAPLCRGAPSTFFSLCPRRQPCREPALLSTPEACGGPVTPSVPNTPGSLPIWQGRTNTVTPHFHSFIFFFPGGWTVQGPELKLLSPLNPQHTKAP